MPPKLRLSFGQKTPAVQGVFPTFKRYKQVPRQQDSRVRAMLARVARYEVEAERIDDAVRVFGEAATEIEGLAGFAGGFVFVDQEDGRTMTVTLWDNTAALENSEPTAGRARRKAADAVGGSVLSVEKFEVAQKLGSGS